jgi:hypothetical protein
VVEELGVVSEVAAFVLVYPVAVGASDFDGKRFSS